MIKTYDPALVVLSVIGNTITGFAEGTMIEIDRNADSFTLNVGSGGSAARVASADKSGTIKFTLQQTAAANDILSAALAKDELTKLGTGPTLVKDASGRTTAGGKDSFILRPAPVTLSNGIEGRQWTIVVPKLELFVGGN